MKYTDEDFKKAIKQYEGFEQVNKRMINLHSNARTKAEQEDLKFWENQARIESLVLDLLKYYYEKRKKDV